MATLRRRDPADAGDDEEMAPIMAPGSPPPSHPTFRAPASGSKVPNGPVNWRQSRAVRVGVVIFLLLVWWFWDSWDSTCPGDVYLNCTPVDRSKGMAIIMPFTGRHVSRVVANLRHWKEKDMHPGFTGVGRVDRIEDFDFLFYYDQHVDSDEFAPMKAEIDAAVAEIGEYFSFFRSHGYIGANLSPEESQNSFGYNILRSHHKTSGTVRQFYGLHERSDLSDKYRHFYYMEPDSFPYKKGWGERVYDLALDPQDFWMKGSMMQYPRPYVIPAIQPYRTQYLYHINGNAIFRLGDPCFQNFLRRLRNEFGDYAFDTSMIYFRMAPEHYGLLQRTMHRFSYTDFMADMGTEPYDPDTFPDTFVFHGKHMFNTKFDWKKMGNY